MNQQVAVLTAAVVLTTWIGLAFTWPLMGFADGDNAVKALRLTNRFAQEQQWKDYTIKLGWADSGFWHTRIYLPDGDIIECEGYPGSAIAKCQP
jgi:hypothetical protein